MSRARDALAHRGSPAHRGELEPLSVWIEYTEEGVRVSLPSASRERLGRARHVDLGISIPLRVLHEVGAGAGDLLVESVVRLSRCTRDELRERGGLVFVSPEEGRVLRSWPA